MKQKTDMYVVYEKRGKKNARPKGSKPKCGICGSYKKVKYYIIADDIENPRPRCKKCMDELTINVLIHLCDKDLYSIIEPCNRKRSKNRRKGAVR